MKRLVTNYLALDIRQLARGGYLSPRTRFEWVWRPIGGAQSTSARAALTDDALHLTYPLGTYQVQQSVLVTYSIWHRDVKRPWFTCPTCHRRVAVLYRQDDLPFRCRRCHGLKYPSQYPSQGHSYGRRHRCLSQTGWARLKQAVGV